MLQTDWTQCHKNFTWFAFRDKPFAIATHCAQGLKKSVSLCVWCAARIKIYQTIPVPVIYQNVKKKGRIPVLGFCVVTPRSLVGSNQRFSGTYRLYLQGWRLGNISPRNVGIYPQVRAALQPRRTTPACSQPWKPQISLEMNHKFFFIIIPLLW